MADELDLKKDDELKKCQAERDEYLNGWKRARADYANFEKEEKRLLKKAEAK